MVLQSATGTTTPEDDAVSVTLLDPKSREWLVRASQCDYQILHKLAAENPRLAFFKVSWKFSRDSSSNTPESRSSV